MLESLYFVEWNQKFEVTGIRTRIQNLTWGK